MLPKCLALEWNHSRNDTAKFPFSGIHFFHREVVCEILGVCVCVFLSCPLLFPIEGPFKKYVRRREEWGEGRSLKNERKRTEGGGMRSILSVRSLREKKCLIFQAANRVLSDKFFGSC